MTPVMKHPNDKRSPLKDKPLRLPGQGLDEERQALLDDRLFAPIMFAMMAIAFAVYEWWRAWAEVPPKPVPFTIAALIATAWAAWRVTTTMPRLKALKLGMAGERAVGQYLEGLRSEGYRVLHDVQGDGFNVDHVCIGPGGVLTIETKTWSKPARGDARIRYDGEHLVVGGREPERDVLRQAKGQAAWLARLLLESTGRPVKVQAVVVFPGWFVEAAMGAQREVWVMEPKGLPAFLANEPVRLNPEDVKLLAFHLSRYVRAVENERSAG